MTDARLLVGAVAAIAAAGLAWSLGRVVTVPPPLVGALLLCTVLGGVFTAGGAGWRLARRDATRRTHLAGLKAAAALGLALLFMWEVLAHDARAVRIEARVAAPPAAAPRRLRVVELNLWHDFPRYRRLAWREAQVLAGMRALAPDVIVLQEAWNTTSHGEIAARLAAELGMDLAYAPANASRRLIGFEEGSAVLSRFPIREARRVVLAPRQGWHVNRIALVARVDIGEGAPLTVVGAHLGRSVSAAQAGSLLAHVPAEGLRVIAADLNARSGSDTLALFEERGLVDAMPGSIDHVLVDAGRGWRVERAGWTLRPEDVRALCGLEERVTNHPAGIVVDLVR